MEKNHDPAANTSSRASGNSRGERGMRRSPCHALLRIIAVKASSASQREMQKAHLGVAPWARGVKINSPVNASHWIEEAVFVKELTFIF